MHKTSGRRYRKERMETSRDPSWQRVWGEGRLFDNRLTCVQAIWIHSTEAQPRYNKTVLAYQANVTIQPDEISVLPHG